MAEDKVLEGSPLEGSAITVKERVSLQNGQFSQVQNLRGRHPGFESRLGCARHHTTADSPASGAKEAVNLYQFAKGSTSEKKFLGQMLDGSLILATDNPPTTTAGVLGTDLLASTSGTIPASFSNLDDHMLYSDGVRQHQVYKGDDSPVVKFVVYKGTSPPDIPEIGEDYSIEVKDGQSETVAVLDGLDANQFFYIMTDIPVNSIGIILKAGKENTNASVMTGEYWNGQWANANITDGTIQPAGDTLGQNGDITWTAPTDELPHYQFGASGFWYKFKVSAQLDAEVEISAVVSDADIQSIINVWDGVFTDAIEAQVYNTTKLAYSLYGTTSIDLGRMATDDFLYVAFTDPISGMYIDIGATPNVTKAFLDDVHAEFVNAGSGTQWDYIQVRDSNLFSEGFEEGQSVTVANTVSNDGSYVVLQVTSNRLFVAAGSLADETDASCDITYSVTPVALDLIEVWDGDSFATLTSLTDGTAGLTQSGFVTWDRTSQTPQPTQFNTSPFYAYWYRISFDKLLSNSVNVGIQGMPYFDISEFGLGVCSGVWKNRPVYTFDLFSSDLYVGTSGFPMSLNGIDWGIIKVGDGRRNAIRAVRQFHNELIVWQEEVGKEGGCTTLIQGDIPERWGTLIISTKVGILNSKCAEVVEGVLTSTESDQKIKKIAVWLSVYGVFVTDGGRIWAVSDDIQNYFDPTHADVINRNYKDKMWVAYDSTDNVIRIGLVSGSSATEPNIFPVLDLTTWTWSFDTYAEPFSCMTEVTAASGSVDVLMMAGASTDGYVYRVNTGTDDIVGSSPTTTAIDESITIEFDGNGNTLQLDEISLRCKAQAAGNIARTIATDGNTTYGDSTNYPMTAEKTNDGYRRNRLLLEASKAEWNHYSVRFRNNTISQAMYITDYGITGKIRGTRK